MDHGVFSFTRTENVRHGGARLVSGGMVAIEAPCGNRWELYTVGEDGLEMFGRYADKDEAAALNLAKAEAKTRGYARIHVKSR